MAPANRFPPRPAFLRHSVAHRRPTAAPKSLRDSPASLRHLPHWRQKPALPRKSSRIWAISSTGPSPSPRAQPAWHDSHTAPLERRGGPFSTPPSRNLNDYLGLVPKPLQRPCRRPSFKLPSPTPSPTSARSPCSAASPAPPSKGKKLLQGPRSPSATWAPEAIPPPRREFE